MSYAVCRWAGRGALTALCCSVVNVIGDEYLLIVEVLNQRLSARVQRDCG